MVVQPGLCLTRSETPEQVSRDGAHIILVLFVFVYSYVTLASETSIQNGCPVFFSDPVLCSYSPRTFHEEVQQQHENTSFMHYANKHAQTDQPVHLHILINALTVHFLDNVKPLNPNFSWTLL